MQTLYKLMDISSKRLIIDRDKYQRKLNEKKVDRIVAMWDERIANEPKVSLRDGVYHVFDGQHTILAREAMNDNNPVKILCKVYYGLTLEDEAALFAKQTGISSKPNSGETLHANLFAGDEEAIAFCNATKDAGLLIDEKGTRHKGYLACIGTALKAFRKMGDAQYTEAMSIIENAWKGNPDSLRFEVVKAITEFVHYYHEQYDKNVLMKALKGKKPLAIRNKIKTDCERPNNVKYAYQIMMLYNAKSESPLPELNLKEKKSDSDEQNSTELPA